LVYELFRSPSALFIFFSYFFHILFIFLFFLFSVSFHLAFFKKNTVYYFSLFLAEISIFEFVRCFASPNSENGGGYMFFVCLYRVLSLFIVFCLFSLCFVCFHLVLSLFIRFLSLLLILFLSLLIIVWFSATVGFL